MDGAIRPFAVDLARPLATADGTIDRRAGFLVRVETDGVAGLGEATPLAGWTESRAACERALADAVGTLRTAGPDAALDDLAGAPAARHGLHLALADRAARVADEPLAGHLADGEDPLPGGGSATAAGGATIPINATVGDGPPGETAAAARDAAGAGFPCVKVKVGSRDAAADADRMAAARDAVGPDVELRADANGAWTRAQADEAVRNYPAAGVDVVEQPLAAGDLRGHAALRGNDVAIALDESLVETGVAAALDAEAADVVVLKPMALGGLDRARAAARAATEAGVDVVVSNTVDAVVARTAAVHLAAALPAVRACGLATADRLATDLAPDPAPVEDGAVAVPDGPGHGVSRAWAGLAADDGEPARSDAEGESNGPGAGGGTSGPDAEGESSGPDADEVPDDA